MKDGGATPWKPHLAFHTTPPHPNRGVVWGCGLHASTPLHTTLLKVWNVPHGLSSPTITSGLSRPVQVSWTRSTLRALFLTHVWRSVLRRWRSASVSEGSP